MLVSRPKPSRRMWRRCSQLLLALCLLGGLFPMPTHVVSTIYAAESVPTATTITVDTSADLDSGSITKTCGYSSGVYVAAGDGCTLRRALLEASARPQSDRPIEIRFNLPAGDPNSDLEVAGTWTLPINDPLPALSTDTILDVNGQVLIDGATQPGGRSDGPSIIIDTNDYSLEVESENNIIRNISFKNGGSIFLKENGNTVENIWMGLTDDGQSIAFRDTANRQRLAGGGIVVAADDNVVQDNVIAGAYARAINIDGGDNNIIQRNTIGTRADGTVPAVAEPAQCLRSFNYDAGNWYGGWGIGLSGSNNQILQNRIAGLHILQSENETPPMAIEIFGSGHRIAENIIGVDSAGEKRGVCGQGIKVSGSNTEIVDNTIVRSRTGFESSNGQALDTAILASDTSPLFGQITVRGNLVEDGPGLIYQFGPGIPDILSLFKAAKITQIDGKNIAGTNGDDSPCPSCLIDFYLDDGDDIEEAFEHLGSTTADSNGDFTFTLADEVPAGMGIRTSSTTQSAGVIGAYGSGTTTEFSDLYMPIAEITLSGPAAGEVGETYTFTATVAPTNATPPFEYTLEATDLSDQSLTSDSPVVVATLTWESAGDKTVRVTVENDLSTATATHEITIAAPPEPEGDTVYLPLVRK